MRLILGSSSPRRRQLLTQAGYVFDVLPPGEDVETGESLGDETIREFVERLAVLKACDVASRLTGTAHIITCDTVADCDGNLLGKPIDRAHARQMLQLLSGRRHRVWSGLCVWSTPSGDFQVQSACSELEMSTLSQEQIEAYLDNDAWQGKSGAFGYQEGHEWLRLVAGTVSNVVGLPLDLLAQMLEAAQFKPDAT